VKKSHTTGWNNCTTPRNIRNRGSQIFVKNGANIFYDADQDVH